MEELDGSSEEKLSSASSTTHLEESIVTWIPPVPFALFGIDLDQKEASKTHTGYTAYVSINIEQAEARCYI